MHSSHPTGAPAAPAASDLSSRARGLLKQLQEKYPVFKECQPLAVGIDKQLLAAMPDIDRKTMRVALSMHTQSSRYLKMMKKAESRFDLQGQPVAEVTKEHRAHARQVLDERYKKEDAKRKAEEQAKVEAEKERRKTEKLELLMAKFSRTGK